jgi:chromosome segregation ATPase
VDRAAFYGTRPYAHLRTEFEKRLETLRQAGNTPDPRDAQITRLKNEIGALRLRLAQRDQELTELAAFKTAALSRIAVQHDEITRLRRAGSDIDSGNLRRLPARGTSIGPCS